MNLLFLPVAVSAQDVVFTHWLSAPMYANPAFTGLFGRYHASAAVRSQFTASANIANTIYAEAATHIPSWNSGIGLFMMNDRTSGGLFQTTSIGLTYGYAFRASETVTLRPALQAVFYMQQRDPKNLTFPDEVGTGASTYFPYEHTSRYRVDFAAGLLIQHPWFQLGGAVQHIGGATPDSLYWYGEQPLKLTFHTQGFIGVSGEKELLSLKEWTAFENILLMPHAQYIHQSGFRYLIAGITVRSGGLFAGLTLRTPLQNNTYLAAALIGLESNSLKIGYSFDFITSGGDLRGWDSGSHEIFLHYSFGNPVDKESRKTRYKVRRLNPVCGCPY